MSRVATDKSADITRQINVIGQQIKENGGSNVAIYLPNSVEFLAALFACSFYDLTAILIPYEQPLEKIVAQLKQSKADTVIAAVGSFPYDAITRSYPALKQLVWVVDEGSKHMDWNEVPEGTGGAVNVTTWQQTMSDSDSSAGTEVPNIDRTTTPKGVVAFWPTGELVYYTQANITAGVAGQLTSIPSVQRIKHGDVFLPVDTLYEIYPLIVTLSALYANASLVLNSVAGRTSDLVLATQGCAPTVIVTGPETLAQTHKEAKAKLNSQVYEIIHWFQNRSLVQHGVMPLATVFSKAFDHLRPIIGTTPGKLRLVFVSEQIGAQAATLSLETLSDLRIYTGARITYALTAAPVAGAVTQTSVYDYRVDEAANTPSHFGAPVTSVEVFLKDTKVHRTSDELSSGEVSLFLTCTICIVLMLMHHRSTLEDLRLLETKRHLGQLERLDQISRLHYFKISIYLVYRIQPEEIYTIDQSTSRIVQFCRLCSAVLHYLSRSFFLRLFRRRHGHGVALPCRKSHHLSHCLRFMHANAQARSLHFSLILINSLMKEAVHRVGEIGVRILHPSSEIPGQCKQNIKSLQCFFQLHFCTTTSNLMKS